MKNLYDVIKENPKLIEGKNFSQTDIAVANYIYLMGSTLVNTKYDEECILHDNSDYNESVANLIENNPQAVKLISSLSKGFGLFIGGIPSQYAFLLVNDYLNNNFSNGYSKHTR